MTKSIFARLALAGLATLGIHAKDVPAGFSDGDLLKMDGSFTDVLATVDGADPSKGGKIGKIFGEMMECSINIMKKYGIDT